MAEEWPAFIDSETSNRAYQNFTANPVSITKLKQTYGLENLIDKLVLVPRLREVRVLRGFHRIQPGDDEKLVHASLTPYPKWMPGIEVFGEGIFISFSEKAIVSWEKEYKNAIGKRIDAMNNRHKESVLSFLPEPTPRFVMLHTLAHLLILQLSFECGYAAASLRERIYSAEPGSESGPMAGFLIYTADSDSEGSLGGLVRQGSPDRLIPTLLTALERGSWCSSDPICRELAGQGLQGLNRAACHCCSLIAETSCTGFNTLLDRMILLGSDEEDGCYGFFSEVLKKISEDNV
jgi:hypothetical protein